MDPPAACAAMVAELEKKHGLRPGPVRDALLALPREVLMPQAYVRRSTPGEEPPRWDLLDWSAPQDRPELLGLLYGGASVLVQHDGEPLLGRVRGARSGASITSMSTVMSLTASLLGELDLRPGLRVLDVGTGAGVTAAVACQVCGDQGVITLDRDRHLTDAAAVRLAELGFWPQVVCGSGEQGVPGREFDRIFVSYAMRRVPAALVEQLAPGGRLLVHVTSASPSWPGLAVLAWPPWVLPRSRFPWSAPHSPSSSLHDARHMDVGLLDSRGGAQAAEALIGGRTQGRLVVVQVGRHLGDLGVAEHRGGRADDLRGVQEQWKFGKEVAHRAARLCGSGLPAGWKSAFQHPGRGVEARLGRRCCRCGSGARPVPRVPGRRGSRRAPAR
ncbi:hypothetical protein M1203_15850 [Streptomyces sp. 35G-GA-8]|nr:hypothetical protein [Streptomyces sp. 35G-GA-8]MCL7378350.1 hypothetical protein [Streptomyces sp. 35G-GA-8]